MKCPKTSLISTYLDEEMGLHEKAAFETHVQSCKDCAQALEEMGRVKALFTDRERHQAPYGFAARVMARTAQQERKKSFRLAPLFMRFAEVVVLLVVILAGVAAGRFVMNGAPARKTANITSSLSLEVFDAAPPGSLAGAYFAMTEARNEK